MAYSAAFEQKRAVNGSLAYEFGYVGGTAAPRREPEVERPTAPPVQEEYVRRSSRPKAAPRQARGVSLSTLVCFVAALGLVVALLSSYVRMIELSDESATLKSELSTLQQQGNQLKVKYESEIDLQEIERYATEELGMVVPGAESIIYVDLSEPDKAVVGDGSVQETPAGQQTALSAVDKILEYFS